MPKDGNDNGALDLGIKPQETKLEPCCHPEKSSEVRYPEVEFRGEHAKMFFAKYGSCAPGDVYMFGSPQGGVEMKVKSASMGENEWDNCIRFCMTKIVGDVVEEESTEEPKEKPEPKRTLKKMSKTTVAAGY